MADPSEGTERALRTRIALKYGQGRGILLDREELALVYRWVAGRSLEQERDELREKLLKHGRHAMFCTVHVHVGDNPFVCNCGWDDLKARLAPPVPKGDS